MLSESRCRVVAGNSVVGGAFHVVRVMDASLGVDLGDPAVDVTVDVDHSTQVWLGALIRTPCLLLKSLACLLPCGPLYPVHALTLLARLLLEDSEVVVVTIFVVMLEICGS